MQCPQCCADNREGRRFCGGCGAHLVRPCPDCRFSNELDEKFCGGCGHPLLVAEQAEQETFDLPQHYTPKYLAEKILTSRSALEGERKQVTVVFCDLANSTGLAEKIGPDRMHTVLNKFFEVAIAEVHRYEGTINQFLGDGFMALFGAPLAHEDHARRAVMAAVGIQRQLGDRQATLPEGVQLRVRIGLNTGLVVVGKIGDNLRMDYTAIGDTTNLAARLQALAEPGAVYISEQTYRLVIRHFTCEYLGRRTVKGKALPVAVHKVLALRVSAKPDSEGVERRLTAPLVGRTKECDVFLQIVDCLLSGRGGIVSVVGEAGVGKSRFMAELRQRVEEKPLLWLEGRALSFSRNISYLPFREIIRSFAGITEEEDQHSGWGKLERSVNELFPSQAAEILPYVATLLGWAVTGEHEKRVKYLAEQGGKALGGQILLSSRRLFERMAQAQPVVLVFEDAHWIDLSSAELLEHLFPLVQTVPLLICAVSRADPELHDARLREIAATKHAAWSIEISLGALSPAESADLLSHLLKADSVSTHIRDQILTKVEGNPFFMEEVIRSLIDMKALVRDEKTRSWQATAQAEEAQIPDTLEAVIIARVDRLEDSLKEVLKLASIIGRRFLYRVLRSIAGRGQELDRALKVLQQLQFIREKSRTAEPEYFFKHALVQEATYKSILFDRRREVHRRVAESLVTLFANGLEEYYGVIAYHYALAEEWEKAQEYLFKAGDQAGKIAADGEALLHYEQAFAAYGRAFGDRWDPMQRAVLERKIGEALFRRGDHEKAIEYLQRALSHLGNPYPVSRLGIRMAIAVQLFRQLGHRMLPSLFLRETQRASNLLPVEEQSRIFKVMTWIDYFTNQERMFLDGLQQLNVSERNGFLKGLAWGFTDVALVFELIPFLVKVAGRYHRRAVQLAERAGDPVEIGHAYLGLAFHEHQGCGNWALGLEYYGRGLAASQEAGELRGMGAITALIAWVHIIRGNFAKSLDYSRKLIRLGQDGRDHQVWGWGEMRMGQALRRMGETDQAITHLEMAVELLEGVPDFVASSMARGDLGQCHLLRGNLQEAVSMLERTNRLVVERGLRGFLCTVACNSLAKTYLIVAEQTAEPAKSALLKKASRACRRALRQCALDREGLSGACRLRGTYEWLTGRVGAAQKWWARSLALAEELEARYDLASTYREMGRHMGKAEYLERARNLFQQIGVKIEW